MMQTRVPARILLVALAAAPLLAQASPLQVREGNTALIVAGDGYECSIGRDGFSLVVRRGGSPIFETAGSRDPLPNLAYVASYGVVRPEKLRAHQVVGDTLSLTYSTNAGGAEAHVEVKLEPKRMRVRMALLGGAAIPRHALRFRLAPSGQWYGGGFQGFDTEAAWPLNKARIEQRFLGDGISQASPFWYATGGVGVWIRTAGDFRDSINAPGQDGLHSVEMDGVASLAWDLLIGKDVREVIQLYLREAGVPTKSPAAANFTLPVYSTWAEFKSKIDQATVLAFAKKIKGLDLPCGIIQIDEGWQTHFGDVEFDATRFPDPAGMVRELNGMGFGVTLWTQPFVNLDSTTYLNADTHGWFVADGGGPAGLIRWWEGTAALWDMANAGARDEFLRRHRDLMQRNGLAGFKFDGGEIDLVPRDARAHGLLPADYADLYNCEAVAKFPWNESRVGVYSQRCGSVQRLMDKHSRWGQKNGIASIIPEVLTVSQRGFFFVMPDMIGGNQYGDDRITKELMVRWTQVAALLPVMEFSYGAWHFDDECMRLVREASRLHMRFAPLIAKLAEESVRTREPIVRALWYNFPGDRETFPVTDEFMLGDGVLVAPVVEKGAVTRDIYLPEGKWMDLKSGETVAGGRWLRAYPAPLDTLPVFTRPAAQ